MSFKSALYSSSILPLSSAVSLWSFMSSIAWACIMERPNFLQSPALASAGVFEALISFITASSLSRAIFNPSKIWARARALLSSKMVRRVTTTLRARMNSASSA